MNNEGMLRVISRHTQESVFQAMRVLVTCAKSTEKIAKHPEYTLARQQFYDLAYPGKLSTASPGNPVGVIKLSSLSLCNRI